MPEKPVAEEKPKQPSGVRVISHFEQVSLEDLMKAFNCQEWEAEEAIRKLGHLWRKWA